MRAVISGMALTLILWTVSHAQEQPRTVGVYKDHISADRKKGATVDHTLHHMLYLTGIGDGFRIINKHRLARGESPLYCLPDDTLLGGADYMKILDNALFRTDSSIENHLPVAEAMLIALVAEYPCQ